MATIGDALERATATLRASGSDTPRLDAELLVAFVAGTDRTAVLAHPEQPLGDVAADRLDAAIRRRAAGEPVAYIRGIKEFHGLAFAVDARALIPRPETELLVELAVERIAARLAGAPRPAGTPPVRIADVGTGSGAIAIAVAVTLRRRGFLPEVELLASDCSADAVALATENAVAHGVADRIRFVEADLLPAGARPFDAILANLPYVPAGQVPGLPVAASFEPRVALDGGPDGLDVIRRLLALLPAALLPGGTALLEIGAGEWPAVRADAERSLDGWPADAHDDLAGIPRVVELCAPVPARVGTGP